jgi:O-antigen/teichoic acid export membrane protein
MGLEPVADIMPILAVGGIAECLNRPQRALLVALGRAGAALVLTFVNAVILLSGVAVGAVAGGLIGAATGYAAASAVQFVPAALYAMHKAGVPARAYLLGLAPILAATAAMALAVVASRAGLGALHAPELIQLMALPAVGAVVYAGALGPPGWRMVGELIGKR